MWSRNLGVLAGCVERFVRTGDSLPQVESIQWEGRPVSFESLVIRHSLHTAYHAGRVAALRSALRQN